MTRTQKVVVLFWLFMSRCSMLLLGAIAIPLLFLGKIEMEELNDRLERPQGTRQRWLGSTSNRNTGMTG